MKFIADAMLGRLVKWLRLLGHDTIYFPHIEDSLLLRIAREENRTLLTRDTHIVKTRGLENFLLLSDNDSLDQLRKVIVTYKLLPYELSKGGPTLPLHSRCSICNSNLENIQKSMAKDHVPRYVYKTSDSFKRCPGCDRYYWKGTHQERMLRKIREIL